MSILIMMMSARTKLQQLLVRSRKAKTMAMTARMVKVGDVTVTRSPSMGLIRRSSTISTLASCSSSVDETPSSSLVSSFLAAASIAAATVAFTSLPHDAHTTECCGIVGVVGTSDHGDAREFLLDGLTILKNRGYDSAGIATIPSKGGEMHITKFASDGDKADSIELVGKHSHSMGHTLGIAHTRWYVCILSCCLARDGNDRLAMT